MTQKIEYEDAVLWLKRAVEEKGEDYIDPGGEEHGCMYFTATGQPSCIVGHMLNYMDLGPKDLYSEQGGDLNKSTSSRLFETVLEGDAKVLLLLHTVQDLQDNGKSWGTALEAAINAVNENAL